MNIRKISFSFLILTSISLLFVSGGLMFEVFSKYLGENWISSIIGIVAIQSGILAISINKTQKSHKEKVFVFFAILILTSHNVFHTYENATNFPIPHFIIAISTGVFIPIMEYLILETLSAKILELHYNEYFANELNTLITKLGEEQSNVKTLQQTEKELRQSKESLQQREKELQQTEKELRQSKEFLQQKEKELQQSKESLQQKENELRQSKDTLQQTEIPNMEEEIRKAKEGQRKYYESLLIQKQQIIDAQNEKLTPEYQYNFARKIQNALRSKNLQRIKEELGEDFYEYIRQMDTILYKSLKI